MTLEFVKRSKISIKLETVTVYFMAVVSDWKFKQQFH